MSSSHHSGKIHGMFVHAQQEANSKEHTPSSTIKGRRRLKPDECETMLQLYKRRCRGESVSKETIAASVNQVYWYGIFHALGV